MATFAITKQISPLEYKKQLGFIYFFKCSGSILKFYEHYSLQKEPSYEYHLVRFLANKFNVVKTTLLY